jgi:DNA-binding HxlR family transcriptional regulator
VARVRTGKRDRQTYLRRLSVVFEDELDLKIVTELYMREMSPKLFHEEFGGGSIPRVNRHFKKLVRHGWLRFLREESGDGRRGGVEHFYRATELAIFDEEIWSLLPYSVKAEFSLRSFKQLTERVLGAMEAGTFDARANRHLSWTPLLLDQLGWDRVIAAINALFESLYEEQEDAKLRIYKTGEEPILVTVGLAGFESPTRGSTQIAPCLVEGEETLAPFSWRLSRVFAEELCLKIVAELNLREMSVTQFHREFGGASVGTIRRRFNMLTEAGWLRRVHDEKGGKRRGATEYFYRATGPAVFDDETWAGVPNAIKMAHSWKTFNQLSERVKEAMIAGTLNSRDDQHLTWSLFLLDQDGWDTAMTAIASLFTFILIEKDRAEDRLIDSGEEPIGMTAAIIGFESPKNSTKMP